MRDDRKPARGLLAPGDDLIEANAGPTPALSGSDTHARRVVSAYLLALNGGRTRGGVLDYQRAARLLGCSAPTVRADWSRPDVQQLAHTSAVAGLRAVALAALRSWLVTLARRAAGGDDAAGRELLAVLDRAGCLPDLLAASSLPDASECAGVIAPGDVFAGPDAAAVLASLLAGSEPGRDE